MSDGKFLVFSVLFAAFFVCHYGMTGDKSDFVGLVVGGWMIGRVTASMRMKHG